MVKYICPHIILGDGVWTCKARQIAAETRAKTLYGMRSYPSISIPCCPANVKKVNGSIICWEMELQHEIGEEDEYGRNSNTSDR